MATAVPIYKHSPYRDHLPNFGPHSDSFTLQVMKLSTSHILSIFVRYGVRSKFPVNMVPIFPKQWSLLGPYRDQVCIGMTCGHTANRTEYKVDLL